MAQSIQVLFNTVSLGSLGASKKGIYKMNTKPINWTKPLQTTDGDKNVKFLHDLGGDKAYPIMTIIDNDYITFNREGYQYDFHKGIQLINVPETTLVEFIVNVYTDGIASHPIVHLLKNDAGLGKGPSHTNRIDFSMQLEFGKNYKVTAIEEVKD